MEEKDCMEVLGINEIMPRRSCMDKSGVRGGLILIMDAEENAIHKL